MGGTARQFNFMYMKYKKTFKKPIQNVGLLISHGFTDEEFVKLFRELYPHMWIDLNRKYEYWHEKNNFIIRKGKKSRYNFRKPYNFIMDCSYGIRKKIRRNPEKISNEEKEKLRKDIMENSYKKLAIYKQKIEKNLYLVQEISPKYEKEYIDYYFKSKDLHVKLEIIRELSKYKSDKIIQFFYKVNACTRNFSLKEESMKYIQGLNLPFVLRRKKKGKKSFIDNEVVKNKSNPEILMQRIFDNELEKKKSFDLFISHNSKDETEIVKIYKKLNKEGLVAYVDWVSDKFDLKRKWCNATTSNVIKARIKQSKFILICLTENLLTSQWCPWEIGYADALGKKICLLNNNEIKDKPEFYDGYARLIFDNNGVFIIENNNRYSINKWLQNNK